MAKLGLAGIAAGVGYVYVTKGGIQAVMHPLILGTVFVALIIVGLLRDA